MWMLRLSLALLLTLSSFTSEAADTARWRKHVSSCVSYFTGIKETFDLEVFESALEGFRQKGYVSEEDVLYSITVPERLVALLEFQSPLQNYRGLGFDDRIQDLSPRDRRKLYKIIHNLIPSDTGMSFTARPVVQLSRFRQKRLLAEIYDVFHKPRWLLRRIIEKKNVRAAYEENRLDKIERRLELSLFYKGMPETFAAITSDPTLGDKFKDQFKKNSAWIEPLIFLGLWATNVTQFPGFISTHAGPNLHGLSEVLRWLPPYLPSFSIFYNDIVTDDDRNVAMNEGLAAAVEKINTRLGTKIDTGQTIHTATLAYLLAFLFLTTMTIDLNIKTELDYQLQADRISVQQQFQDTASKVGDFANFGKLDAKQKAETQVNHAIDLLNADGEKIDPNSQEMKELKEEFARIYAKSDERENARKKKPNR